MTLPNPCCCGGDCDIYADAFTTDTIDDWEEVSGSWSIAGGILSIEDANAALIADTVHPDGANEPSVVRSDVRFGAALDKARLIANYIDVDNYFFCEFWIDEDDCFHIQAYERVSSVNTPLGVEYTLPFTTALEAWHTVSLCCVPSEFPDEPTALTMRVKAATGEVWTRSVETSDSPAGDRAGVGTGTPVDDTIDFDNFKFQYYYDSEAHPTCPQCAASANCELNSDDFNRANSTNVSCTWDEVAGDWEIDTNELTIDEEDAILVNRTPHPDNLANVQVQFDFRCEAGVVIMVILDYTDDENFFFVQLEPGSHGDCGEVSFWRRTANVDSQVGMSSLLLGMTADADEEHSITICWRDQFVKATLTPFAGDYDISSHTVNGVEQVATEPFVGLGTGTGGGSSQVWFDDFTLHKVLDEEVEGTELCPECTPKNCVVYFNDPRLDGTDFLTTFNCLWSIEAGSWTVNQLTSSNAETLFGIATTGGTAFTELIEVSTDSAMLFNLTGHPMTTTEGFLDLTSGAEVQVISFNYSDVVRILIGVEDDQNYLYAEWEWAADDESTGFLRVGKVVAGVETEIDEQASSVTAGQPHGDHDGSVVDQLPSILRVCYDGLELRATFTNLSDVSFSSANKTYAYGDAGTGFNPGMSGLATGAITDEVYFGGFKFYHDIFGGDPECAPCDIGVTCGFCVQTVDMVEEDRTPPIVLVQIQDLSPNTDTGCDEGEQFNDTFALPFQEFQTTGATACHWRVRPHFCDGGAPANLPAQILFTIESTGPDLSTANAEFELRVLLRAYDPADPAPSYGSASATWDAGMFFYPGDLPNYENNNGFDCNEFLVDWITIAGGPSGGASWLIPGGSSDPSFARVKVLA